MRIKGVLGGAAAPGFVCSEKYVSLRKINSVLQIYVISRKMKKNMRILKMHSKQF